MTLLRTLPAAFLFMTCSAFADPAQIESTQVHLTSRDWRFDVTLSHADTGWEDYANGWRVEMKDGTVLGTRVLHHPHVSEQPFTRSLSGVIVPDGTVQVFIRARTNVTGWATDRHSITLP